MKDGKTTGDDVTSEPRRLPWRRLYHDVGVAGLLHTSAAHHESGFQESEAALRLLFATNHDVGSGHVPGKLDPFARKQTRIRGNGCAGLTDGKLDAILETDNDVTERRDYVSNSFFRQFLQVSDVKRHTPSAPDGDSSGNDQDVSAHKCRRKTRKSRSNRRHTVGGESAINVTDIQQWITDSTGQNAACDVTASDDDAMPVIARPKILRSKMALTRGGRESDCYAREKRERENVVAKIEKGSPPGASCSWGSADTTGHCDGTNGGGNGSLIAGYPSETEKILARGIYRNTNCFLTPRPFARNATQHHSSVTWIRDRDRPDSDVTNSKKASDGRMENGTREDISTTSSEGEAVITDSRYDTFLDLSKLDIPDDDVIDDVSEEVEDSTCEVEVNNGHTHVNCNGQIGFSQTEAISCEVKDTESDRKDGVNNSSKMLGGNEDNCQTQGKENEQKPTNDAHESIEGQNNNANTHHNENQPVPRTAVTSTEENAVVICVTDEGYPHKDNQNDENLDDNLASIPNTAMNGADITATTDKPAKNDEEISIDKLRDNDQTEDSTKICGVGQQEAKVELDLTSVQKEHCDSEDIDENRDNAENLPKCETMVSEDNADQSISNGSVAVIIDEREETKNNEKAANARSADSVSSGDNDSRSESSSHVTSDDVEMTYTFEQNTPFSVRDKTLSLDRNAFKVCEIPPFSRKGKKDQQETEEGGVKAAMQSGLQRLYQITLSSVGASEKGFIKIKDLFDLIEGKGVRLSDPRLKATFRQIEVEPQAADTVLTFEVFSRICEPSFKFIRSILLSQLTIPGFSIFKLRMQRIFESVRALLDEVVEEPDKSIESCSNYNVMMRRHKQSNGANLSLAVCTVDGQRLSLGEKETPHPLNSCASVFNYCLACQQNGIKRVSAHIGHEAMPSNKNNFSFDGQGRVWNPFTKAGSFASMTLLFQQSMIEKRLDTLHSFYSQLVGQEPICCDNLSYNYRRNYAHEEVALAYYLSSAQRLPRGSSAELAELTEFYIQSISTAMTADAASVGVGTLANRGRCPLTGVPVVDRETAKAALKVMKSSATKSAAVSLHQSQDVIGTWDENGSILFVVPGVLGLTCFTHCQSFNAMQKVANHLAKELNENFNFEVYKSLKDNKSSDKKKR